MNSSKSTSSIENPKQSGSGEKPSRLGKFRDSKVATSWPKWAPIALAVFTALLYLYNLSINGYANSFYAAAEQAGGNNWTAFFFGSSDFGNSITVDKTPLSLWPSALLVRIFGLSSWAILVPQALEGVAAVELLRRTVRLAVKDKPLGDIAGLVAGFALAITPVAALMFRFNNPDAMLVLLMVAAMWATTHALRDGRIRWMALAGVFIGLGFLAKQLQVMLIVPAVFGVWLLCGKPKLGRRILGAVVGVLTTIVSAGWYIAIVELWPASSRPWIGGSQNNSLIELTLGYNGLGRLNGNEVGQIGGGAGGNAADGAAGTAGSYLSSLASGEMPTPPAGMGEGGGPGGGGGGMGASQGVLRLFGSGINGEASWLLPLAIVILIVGLIAYWRRPRTDELRAALLLWGGWTVVTAVVFSAMQGIFHDYYTVALAPGIAALVGLGVPVFVHNRDKLWVRIVAALAILGTGIWSGSILISANWFAWLGWLIIVTGAVAGLLILLNRRLRIRNTIAAILIAFTLFAGPAAWTAETVTTAHTGSIITAGPASASRGGPGGMGGPGRDGGDGNGAPQGMPGMPGTDGSSTDGSSNMPSMGTPPALPGGQTDGNTGSMGTPPSLPGSQTDGSTGTQTDGQSAAEGMSGPGGGMGGLLNSSKPSDEILAALSENGDNYRWVAAAIGSQSASGYQLYSGYSVMPIGGFNGSDPSPTLEEFKEYVANGDIHWFIASGGFGAGAGTDHDNSGDISSWVEENFTSVTIDGVTMYDLTSPLETAN